MERAKREEGNRELITRYRQHSIQFKFKLHAVNADAIHGMHFKLNWLSRQASEIHEVREENVMNDERPPPHSFVSSIRFILQQINSTRCAKGTKLI